MRRTTLAAILFAGMLSMLAPTLTASASWSVSISTFHETLAPHGRWVVTRSYGEVWAPGGIAADWEPYWDGEWVWTDYGWTWVSSDPWGDLPYHYGTWVWVDPYGWVWVPGTVWAPAWVTWAWTDNSIGWAPVPATFVIGATGYAGPAVVAAASRYIFVPASQFVGVNVRSVRLPATQNAVFLPRARKATSFTVAGGFVRATGNPPRTFVERVSKKRIEPASIDRVKTRPTTLAAAHLSGQHIRVVVPARERAAAFAQAKRNDARSEEGKQARPATASPGTSKRGVEPRKETRASKPRSSPARAAQVGPRDVSRPAPGHAVGQPKEKQPPVTSAKHDRAGTAPGAPKERARENTSQPNKHEHERAVPPPRAEKPKATTRSQYSQPARRADREPPTAKASSPRGSGKPQGAPPSAQAGRPLPQEQPHAAPPAPKEKEKEKGKDRR